MVGSPVGKGSAVTADHSPDRVSLLHKGGESIMAQRVRKPHRGKIPSSSGQLPVPRALNARLSTLFAHTIHQMSKKVKGKWKKMEKIFGVCLILASPFGRGAPKGGGEGNEPSLRLAKSRPTGGCSLAQRLRALESRLAPCQLSQRESRDR